MKEGIEMLARLMAILVAFVIPGAVAAYGFRTMRDTIFVYFDPQVHQFLALRFCSGFLLFSLGVAFIGGYILHRDRKQSRVQKRFQRKI